MKLSDKLRSLRGKEGSLRGLGRALTQGEVSRILQEELGKSLSQSYLSQIESGRRPHLTNTSRLLLARFFKVHPGYLVDDLDEGHVGVTSNTRLSEDKLDVWLISGAERFHRDPELRQALLKLARHADSRNCLLLLEKLLERPDFPEGLLGLLPPQRTPIDQIGLPVSPTVQEFQLFTTFLPEGEKHD